ncbi:hypothetical protein L798_06289 [Zootermopsis nevadensis]|uniref:Uncharacterized protein n=1 Tax=Zootermopsis nevadensis TaxID=136037 RepID=A0A067RGC2_ZOONE|nr:hypothetical protein L798_06289 [Zootermopsis nevadensis]
MKTNSYTKSKAQDSITHVVEIMSYKNDRAPLSCSLLRVVEVFSSSDIDTSLVTQLLAHCQEIAESILACETNSFHSEVMYQTVHQLEWQKRTLMEMMYNDDSTSGAKNTWEHSTNADSDKSARRRCIEDTRQVPSAGGLDTVAGLPETKKLLREAVLLPLKFPHLFTGAAQTKIQ